MSVVGGKIRTWVKPLVLGGAMTALASAAFAGPALDRVRTSHFVHCGAAARPGLFAQDENSAPRGLLADLCRAFGVAAGPDVGVAMNVYDTDASYDSVRSGRDDVFFLTGSEIVDQKLAGQILPGPVVFTESSALMVAAGSPAQRPEDLAGQPICFLQGDVSHRQLEAFFAARRLPFIRPRRGARLAQCARSTQRRRQAQRTRRAQSRRLVRCTQLVRSTQLVQPTQLFPPTRQAKPSRLAWVGVPAQRSKRAVNLLGQHHPR